MTNKNKIINQAQKFITKGQWDKAIKELQKLIAEDPKDVRTLLKLGDVHSKKGDREAATRVYRQVAESYSEQGFFLKAVAVYKQILKHDPKHMEVTFKLAELYEHLGLTSEAMGQYQVASQLHEERGEVKESLDVLRRMVELDAENVASRIKLAESYSRESMIVEAIDEFEKAADVLKRQNRVDDYLKVAERLVYHAPDRYDLIKDIARLYLKRADAKRALAKLQTCFKANPKDLDTLALLAQAFGDLGQAQKTVFVYKELQAVHRELGQLADVARVQSIINHLESQSRGGFTDTSPFPAGQPEGMFSSYGSGPDQGAQSLSNAFPQAIPSSGSAPGSALGLAQLPVPESSPVFPGAPRGAPSTPQPFLRSPSLPPPPPPFRATSNHDSEVVDDALILDEAVPSSTPMAPPIPPREADNDQINKILTETDVYVKYGLRDKALDHLRKIFQLDVDNLAAYVKMRDIYLSLGDSSRAAEAIANMLHIHARRGDADAIVGTKAELARLAPGHPLLSGGLPGGLPRSSPTSEESLSIDIDEDSGVFEMVDFAESGDVDVDSGSIELEVPADGGEDLVGELAFEPETDYEPEAPASPPQSSVPIPMGNASGSDWSASMPEDGSMPFDEERTVHVMDEPALASSDIAFLQPTPKATQVFTRDEPEVELDDGGGFDDPLDFGGPAPAEPAEPSYSQVDPFGGNVISQVMEVPNELVLDSTTEDEEIEDEEIEDEALQDVEDDAPETATFSSEDPTGEAVNPIPAPQPRALSNEPDPGYEDELAEVQFLVDQGLSEEAIEALRAILEESPDNQAAEAMLAQLLASAEETLEAPASNSAPEAPSGSAPLDDQTAGDHYDQGMLFMDLGRHVDAVREFHEAARSPTRTVAALEMIGHCYVQQGSFEQAVENFAVALESGADGYAATNIKYEIGNALEASGDKSGAIRWFRACYASDPTHRDTPERLANLGASTEAQGPNGAHGANGSSPPQHSSAPPSTKKAKISYL